MKRQVPFSTLITLINNRKPFSILGIVFVFASLFILLPSIYFLTNAFVEPFEKYDFEQIEQNGTQQEAKITDVSPVNNITINGEHPLRISYEFIDNGVTKSDQFQTMDLEKTNNLEIGSTIPIKTFENQSKIQGLEPFTFPFYVFYLLPLVFLVLGVIFSIIGVVPAFREYNLYKNGVIREATLISLTLNSGIRQRVAINYYHTDRSGQKVFGAYKTKDLSILTEKKAEDTIKIFVAEDDETKSCPVPKLEAMKYNWEV